MAANVCAGGLKSAGFWLLSVVAAASVAGVAAGPLSASPEDTPMATCADLAASRAGLDRLERDGSVDVLTDLEGERARQWVSMLNRLPPQTAIPADAVLVATSGKADGEVLVALFQDGCELGVGSLPRDAFLAIDAAVTQADSPA
jgi:hypothetical protein